MTESNRAKPSWPLHLSKKETIHLNSLGERLLAGFERLLAEESINTSDEFAHLLRHIYLPFCHWLVKQQNQPLVVGINGAQGSGKSTLTRILKYLLESGFNKQVAYLSIDDLYKTRTQRLQLAETRHPLLKTRGVPGTHDTELGINILSQLKSKNNEPISIPVFDKATDDRLDKSQWQQHYGECDFILFEGWCVGTTAEDDQALEKAINTLEHNEDKDASWRKFVNQQLEEDYARLFSFIDIQLLLKVPAFEKVYEWRQLQEKKLLSKEQQKSAARKSNNVMNEEEIKRFIMHYERLTRHTLNEMPDRCDVLFELGDDHMIKAVKARCD